MCVRPGVAGTDCYWGVTTQFPLHLFSSVCAPSFSRPFSLFCVFACRRKLQWQTAWNSAWSSLDRLQISTRQTAVSLKEYSAPTLSMSPAEWGSVDLCASASLLSFCKGSCFFSNTSTHRLLLSRKHCTQGWLIKCLFIRRHLFWLILMFAPLCLRPYKKISCRLDMIDQQ